MPDREKVIPWLEEAVEYFRQNRKDLSLGSMTENCLWQMQHATSNAIILLKAQEPGWISVKDRLPCDGLFVLVCNDDGHMMIAKYESEMVRWEYKYTNYDHDVWDDDEQGPVCWWKPLPEPPKEGT